MNRFLLFSYIFVAATLGCLAPYTNQWTYVGGNNQTNVTSVGGLSGQASTSFYPASRAYGAMVSDSSDNLWIFGGFATSSVKNDLWSFSSKTGEFALWVPTGAPVARMKHTAACDSNDMMWVFGTKMER